MLPWVFNVNPYFNLLLSGTTYRQYVRHCPLLLSSTLLIQHFSTLLCWDLKYWVSWFQLSMASSRLYSWLAVFSIISISCIMGLVVFLFILECWASTQLVFHALGCPLFPRLQDYSWLLEDGILTATILLVRMTCFLLLAHACINSILSWFWFLLWGLLSV